MVVLLVICPSLGKPVRPFALAQPLQLVEQPLAYRLDLFFRRLHLFDALLLRLGAMQLHDADRLRDGDFRLDALDVSSGSKLLFAASTSFISIAARPVSSTASHLARKTGCFIRRA